MHSEGKALMVELLRRCPEAADWFRSASEVVVFGSYASGQEAPGSDIDVLFVGQGRRCKTRLVDIQWRTDSEIASEGWRQSELANHIAKFGVWLKGAGEWRSGCRISESTLASKSLVVGKRLLAIWVHRGRISRVRRLLLLRPVLLDVLRLACLDLGVPPPATASLLRSFGDRYGALRNRVKGLSHLGRPLQCLLQEAIGARTKSVCTDLVVSVLDEMAADKEANGPFERRREPKARKAIVKIRGGGA